jgi:hypothetical protein
MEYLLLIYEFFKTRKRKTIAIPLLIGGLVYYFSGKPYFAENGAMIQGNILTVVGILLGFTISIFAVFLGGNGGSIEESKKHLTKFSLCQKEVSLHTIVLIGLGYITLIEGILLAISVLSPIFFDITTIAGRIIFAFSIFLLIHSVFLTLRTILDFYFIITKDR